MLHMRNFFRTSNILGICLKSRIATSCILPSRSLHVATSTIQLAFKHLRWPTPRGYTCSLKLPQLCQKYNTFFSTTADLPTQEQLDNESRTVFLRSLSPSTTDACLLEYFSKVGEVEDTKIILTLSGKPKGFAFVRFKEIETTEQVLHEEHFINNRVVSAEKLTIFRSVYVTNIPSSLSSKQAREYFSQFGNIESVKVPQNLKTKERKGYCLIRFHSEKDAYEVVKRGTHNINGFDVIAEFEMNLKQPRKLQVINLPYDTTVDDLESYFSKYIGLKEIDLMVVPEKRQCEAFLTFTNDQSVGDILNEGDMRFKSNLIRGKQVSERFAGRARSKSLLIENLPMTITKADLVNHFSCFGPVRTVNIVKSSHNNGNNNTQFGIVKFKYNGGLKMAVKQTVHTIDTKHYIVRQLGLLVHDDKDIQVADDVDNW